jgi:hypothetical protein
MRPRLTYANVVATLALFIALGGASYAAFKLPKNSVGTKQLKKNAVTTAKLKKGAVTAAKLKPGTIPGIPTTVPNSDHATSADSATVAGNGAQRIDFHSAGIDSAPLNFFETPAAHQVFSSDGLTIRASCISGEKARLYVTISASEGNAFWGYTKYVNPGWESKSEGLFLGPTNLETYRLVDVTGENRSEIGELIYRSPSHTVTVMYLGGAEDVLPKECEFQGTAVATG